MPTSSTISLNPILNKVYSAAGTNDNAAFILPAINQPTVVGLSMRVLTPLPLEAKANAYFRFAHPSVQYKVKVGIKGGKPPFRYTLVAGPAGATINNSGTEQTFIPTQDPATGKTILTPPTNIGLVTWQPEENQIGNTFLFRVKVEDQNRNVIFATWQCVVDPSAFLVFDSVNGNNANPGTWVSPLANFDAHATMPSGKIGIFKNGVYPVTAAVQSVNDQTSKMQSFIGAGNNVVFDNSVTAFGSSTWATDITCINVIFSGSPNPPTSEGYSTFRFGGGLRRGLWVQCKWTNLLNGGITAENAGCIFTGNIAVSQNALVDLPITHLNTNIVISECESDETVTVQHLVTFSSKYVLYENNRTIFPATDPASSPPALFQTHAKDQTSEITVRFNHCSGASAAHGGHSFANQSAFHCVGQEFCFNTVVLTRGSPLMWNGQNTVAGNVANGQRLGATNLYSYRNTLVSQNSGAVIFIPNYLGAVEPVNLEDNVLVTNGAALFATNYTPATGWTLVGTNDKLATTDVDAQGKLVGSARQTRLGFEGAEIAY